MLIHIINREKDSQTDSQTNEGRLIAVCSLVLCLNANNILPVTESVVTSHIITN